MELNQYIRLFRRWLWLVVLAAFVAGSIGFITRSGQQATYRARTKILIGSALYDPNPDSSSIRTPADLAQIYLELVRTQRVLQATIEGLNLEMTAGTLRGIISTRVVPNTPLIEIYASYTDPVLAAEIANEISRQLILQSPTNVPEEQLVLINTANAQIDTLSEQLEQWQSEIATIEEELADTTDEEEIADLTAQRDTLRDYLLQATANIATLNDTIATIQQRINSLEIIEEASVSTVPVGTSPLNATVVSAVVGIVLAVGVILLIEYMRDTIKSSDEVARTLNSPILGVISRFGNSKDAYSNKLISSKMLFSRTAEEYRGLRTNLLFATGEEKEKVYLVTSPAPQDGKSITIANLAVSMALAERRVLLIDADLRRPRVHEIFGVNNEMGLTTLLATRLKDNVLDISPDNPWQQCIQQTNIPNLQVITSGFLPKNPTEILGSVVLKHWIKVFQRRLNIDVILFDTPPCLVVSDSIVLAKAINAQVLLVLQANVTRRDIAVRAKERFTNVDWDIAGVVLNGTNPKDEDYYGYYTYYYQPTKQSTKH